MDTEKPVFGIPIVVALTFAIMRFTPRGFDRQRFAIPVSFIVAIVLSIVDTLIYVQGNIAQAVYTAVLRGVAVGFAAVGAHSTYKNYSKKDSDAP
jgi:hypothetical protein